MEAVKNDKKVWVAPTVQVLNINSETYSSPGRGNRETNRQASKTIS